MKLIFLSFILVLLLTSFSVLAQEIPESDAINIQVSVKEPKISFQAESILVDIKITNNSQTSVNTKQFEAMYLNLYKDLNGKSVENAEGTFFEIKPVMLNKGESTEFQIDIKKLEWLEYSQSSTFSISKNKYKPLLLGMYYLSVMIGNCKNSSLQNPLQTQHLEDQSCQSNKVFVFFEGPKT